MRLLISCALLLTALAPAFCQTVNSGPAFPTDPRAILNAAAPFYDFASPDMKPWHLKAEYQLYDPGGKPTDEGTFEYWWASPKVYRSSWTRAGVSYSEWSTADGATHEMGNGDALHFFEKTIEEILFSPLPVNDLLDPTRIELSYKPSQKAALTCVTAKPKSEAVGKFLADDPDSENDFCFDPSVMVLRVVFAHHLIIEYSAVVQLQAHHLPRQVVIKADGQQTLFSVSVDPVQPVDSTDAALNPPAGSTLVPDAAASKTNHGFELTRGYLQKFTLPDEPLWARMNNQHGVIIFAYLIGTDGKVHDLELLASPSDSMAISLLNAMKKWQYKPFLLKNGHPAEIRTVEDLVY